MWVTGLWDLTVPLRTTLLCSGPLVWDDFASFQGSGVHQLCAVVLVCCSIEKPKGNNSTEVFKTEKRI